MIGKEFKPLKNIKKIVFTPAANPIYCYQSMYLLKKLKEKFNDAEILVSFHRGLEGSQRKIAKFAKNLNIEIYDAHGAAFKLGIYDDFDLHIGYRVHAHIYFLSMRKPSYLIMEDSRGYGIINTFGGCEISAYSDLCRNMLPHRISEIAYNSI